MSWLSKVTGIGINPLKGKIKIDPLKALGTGLTVASFGGLGPLAGVAGKVGSVASHIPGAGTVGKVYNTIRGSKLDPLAGKSLPGVGTTYDARSGERPRMGGGLIDDITGFVHDVRKASGAKPITLKNTLGGVVRKIGGTILNNPLETAGGIAAGVSAAQAYKRAGDYEGKAIKTKEQSYAERAPLRQRGVAGMLKDTSQPHHDLLNEQNPFARKRKVTL